MIQAILMMMPDEVFPALLVVGGLLFIVGFRGIGGSLIGFVLLMAFMGPFIDSFLEMLPTWVSLLLIGIIAVSLVGTILGKGVRDNLIAYTIIMLIGLPFRILRWFFKGWTSQK